MSHTLRCGTDEATSMIPSILVGLALAGIMYNIYRFFANIQDAAK